MNVFEDIEYANCFWLSPDDYMVVSFPYDVTIPLKLYHFTGSMSLTGVYFSDVEVFCLYRVPKSLIPSILKLWKSKS